MNQQSKKRLAIIAFIGVWIIAIVRIFSTNSQDSNVMNQKKNQKSEYEKSLIAFSKLENIFEKILEKRKSLLDYTPISGDPFGGYDLLPLKTQEEKNSQTVEKEIITTQLRLTGVLWDEKEPYVFIVHTNGQSYTKKTNDVIEGEKIIKIFPDHIITIRDGQKFKVTTSGFERVE